MNQDDDTDTPAPRRDFRADNVARDRFRPKRSGRAYTVQEESDPDDEDEKQVRFSDAVEEVPLQASAMVSTTAPSLEATPAAVPKTEVLSEVVLRVLEKSGWRPPTGKYRSEQQSPEFGRVGLKMTPQLCVLVYVGPELRRQRQPEHQCMSVRPDDDTSLPDQSRL
jgi:hypothetical protein